MEKEVKVVELDFSSIRDIVKKCQKEKLVTGCPMYDEAIYHYFMKDRRRVIDIIHHGGKDGVEVHYVEIGPVVYASKYFEEIFETFFKKA